MEETLIKIQDWAALYGLKAIIGILILFIGRYIAKALKSLLKRVLQRANLDDTLVLFFSNISYVALMAFVILAALEQIGIRTTSFIAVLGAAGLAVGLALQGSLGNFAAGVLLIIFKPFKVGDSIEAAGATGIVEEIGIFTTELRSPDNKKIIVPNGKITADKISNCSVNDTRRIEVALGVNNCDSLDKVKGLLRKTLETAEPIIKVPIPLIGLQELGDKSIKLSVQFWVKTEDCPMVIFDIFETIKRSFDTENIPITLSHK